MPQPTYLHTILRAFIAMNIDGLRLYLKDEYTYEEAPKEIFLDKIADIFETHRNLGDTHLQLYTGACNGKTCDNCGKRGYRLVGNRSKNYIDLIFEMKGEDITDIYSCEEFQTDIEIPDLGSPGSIWINLDERSSFPKSADYWARVYAAQEAYNELITTPPRKLDFAELKYWLDKHAELYKRIGSYDVFSPQMRWTPFLMLYSDSQKMASLILEYLDEIIQASREYKEAATEPALIDWLIQHEAIYEKGTVDLMYSVVKNGEDFYYDKPNSLRFKGKIFREIFGFFETYAPLHEKMLEKYSIYTKKETSEFYSEKYSQKEIPDVYSLQYHLQKRKELEELGIVLPYYMKNKEKPDEQIPF